MISAKYLLIISCISSFVVCANPPSKQHAHTREKFIHLLEVSNDMAKNICAHRISNPVNTKQILELYHVNETMKKQIEQMQAFGIFDKKELICINSSVQSMDRILDIFQHAITRGLKMLDSRQLLHAKIARNKKNS